MNYTTNIGYDCYECYIVRAPIINPTHFEIIIIITMFLFHYVSLISMVYVLTYLDVVNISCYSI